MKTWYNSKIFMKFVDFSFMIFWSKMFQYFQTKICRDQNMFILLISNTYNENIQTFWFKKLCMKT